MTKICIKKKAEVTVFLTLICLILIAFISVVIRSAKEISIRMKIEAITDIAVRSAFSEYDKKLFDDYGLLYVDTTYKGEEDGGDDSFSNHVSQYISVNLESDDELNSCITFLYTNISNSTYANVGNYSEDLCEEIRKDIRESTNDRFDFETLLESADVTACFEGEDGKVYECSKYYSLAE